MAMTYERFGPNYASSEFYARSLRHEVLVSYLVVIIQRGATYGAHLPDIPGCIATSTDLGMVKELIRDGLALHLEGILEDGDELPAARTTHFVKTPSKEEEEEIEQGPIRIKVPIATHAFSVPPYAKAYQG